MAFLVELLAKSTSKLVLWESSADHVHYLREDEVGDKAGLDNEVRSRVAYEVSVTYTEECKVVVDLCCWLEGHIFLIQRLTIEYINIGEQHTDLEV